MLKVEMEASTRNYLTRLLEQRKEYLSSQNITKLQREYELTQISVANANLMGRVPKIALGKNQSIINFGLGEND